MSVVLYTTEILRLAASLQGPRALDRVDGGADLRSPTCGSRVSTTVQVGADGQLEGISQQVHACAFGQASAALVEKHAIGCARSDISDAVVSLSAWLSGERDERVPWPGLSALAPARTRPSRHGAILLPFRALLAAMESVG